MGKRPILSPKKLQGEELGGGNRARGARGEGLTALSQAGEQRLKELRQEGADVPLGTIEDWLEKRAKRLSAAQSNRYRGLGVSQRGGITPGGAWGPRRWPGLPQSLIPEPCASSWHPWGPVCVAHLPRGHVQVSPHDVGDKAGPTARGCSPREGRQRVGYPRALGSTHGRVWEAVAAAALSYWCLLRVAGGRAHLLPAPPILCLPCLRVPARPCLLLRQAEGGISSSSQQRDACLRVPAVPSLT